MESGRVSIVQTTIGMLPTYLSITYREERETCCGSGRRQEAVTLMAFCYGLLKVPPNKRARIAR